VSQVSQRARLTLIVADVAIADPQGKVNILGAGVATLGFDPNQGVTTRFSVVAQVDVPGSLTPVEASIDVVLLRDGQPVQVSGPAGHQAVRIGHAPVFEKPQASGPVSLREQLDSRQQFVLDFSAGLPLQPGVVYEWALQVDGDEDTRITYPIAVQATPTAPVVG
jgi:hypothetical protein